MYDIVNQSIQTPQKAVSPPTSSLRMLKDQMPAATKAFTISRLWTNL
jgi:hypothetical protein